MCEGLPEQDQGPCEDRANASATGRCATRPPAWVCVCGSPAMSHCIPGLSCGGHVRLAPTQSTRIQCMKSRLVVGGEGSVGMEGLHEPEEVGHRRPGLALALGGAMMPQTVRPHVWVGGSAHLGRMCSSTASYCPRTSPGRSAHAMFCRFIFKDRVRYGYKPCRLIPRCCSGRAPCSLTSTPWTQTPPWKPLHQTAQSVCDGLDRLGW